MKKIISAFRSHGHTDDDEEVDIEVSIKDGLVHIKEDGAGTLILNRHEAIQLRDAMMLAVLEVGE